MGPSLELQCLLQTFLSQNALTEINLRAVVGQLLHQGSSDVSRADVLQEVDRLNEEIADLDIEIRRTILQVDCSDVWVLCNTTSDAITQLATVHNANEIGFFKNLLTCMFVKNNTHRSEIFAVPTMEALNEAQEAKLSKSQAQTALKKFVAESWLSKSPSGFYTLTARSLVELQGYLKDNFGDPVDEQSALRTCHACKEYLIMVYLFRCTLTNVH